MAVFSMVCGKALVKRLFAALLTETSYRYCRGELPRVVGYHDGLVWWVGELFLEPDEERFLFGCVELWGHLKSTGRKTSWPLGASC
jgi:hypothetical protein